MQAGRYAPAQQAVCKDGQTAPAGPRARESPGGLDSVATAAALKQRAQGARYEPAESTAAGRQPGPGQAQPSERTRRDTTMRDTTRPQ
jgi:hypothetical protein